jgi:hypothetical protein
MTDLKAEETAAELEDTKRREREQCERAGVLEDLLHSAIGELAEARAGRNAIREALLEAERKLTREKLNVRHLAGRLKLALDFIEDDHFDRTNHRRATGAKAFNGCKACQLYLQVLKDVEAFGKELA